MCQWHFSKNQTTLYNKFCMIDFTFTSHILMSCFNVILRKEWFFNEPTSLVLVTLFLDHYGIFHVVSRFPPHFMYVHGKLDYILDSALAVLNILDLVLQSKYCTGINEIFPYLKVSIWLICNISDISQFRNYLLKKG